MELLEGSRAFDITWGTVTGLLCLSVAVPALMWVLPGRTRRIFGAAVDPHQRLQAAWGLFAMFMAFTNVGCRYIDHAYLEGVHEGFFAVTLVVLAVLVPAVLRARRPAIEKTSPAQCAVAEPLSV
jgi:hypothetical protein